MKFAGRVGDSRNVPHQPRAVDEPRHGRPLLGFLVNHQRCAYAAVRVAAAGERAPLRFRPVHQVGETRECADEGNREPVARRFDLAYLLADVLRQVRKRVALAMPALGRNVFVAPGKRNRLEAHESDLPGVFHGEFDNRTNLVVVHVVDDGHDQHDLDAGFTSKRLPTWR